MFGQESGCARTLITRKFACCVKDTDQVRMERIFSLATFGRSGAYILYRLNFLHARYACSGWNCHWVTSTVFRLPRAAVGVV